MARTSRKTQRIQEKEQSNQRKNNVPELWENGLRTAAYVRLSLENGGNETEDTLWTQAALLQDFIVSHEELIFEDLYMDNGCSGTSFDRPEFERMMRDVYAGKIQCIVVKDLSRFGRDYLETGQYLEQVFPKRNVRFISVSDHFDTAKKNAADSMEVLVKNIINSLYAKDISRKVALANEMKRKKGEVGGGFAPYGYLVDKEKRAYVIDEETAPYVRAIYQWYLMGVPKREICRRMEFAGAVGLRRHQQMLSGVETVSGKDCWQPTSVSRILTSPVYTGDLVQGKTSSALYMGSRMRHMPKECWTIHPNAHEAIILRSDYEKVQKKIENEKERWRKAATGLQTHQTEEVNACRGLVYCGCCGKPMLFRKRNRAFGTDSYHVYVCGNREHTSLCLGHSMHENLLKILVMDQVETLVTSIYNKKEYVQLAVCGRDCKGAAGKRQTYLETIGRQILTLTNRLEQLYKDYIGGLLEREDYITIKEELRLRKQQLIEQKHKLMQKQRQLEERAKEILEWIEILEPYQGCREFAPELIQLLIKKIEVHPDNTVDIFFGCKKLLLDMQEILEEVCEDGEKACVLPETFNC